MCVLYKPHVFEEINQYWSNLSKLVIMLNKLGEGGYLDSEVIMIGF